LLLLKDLFELKEANLAITSDIMRTDHPAYFLSINIGPA